MVFFDYPLSYQPPSGGCGGLSGGMRRFGWVGPGTVPASADLRRRGWQLRARATYGPEADVDGAEQFLLLVDAGHRPAMRWLEDESAVAHRRWARLLALGVGDVLGGQATLAEVDARASRIVGLGDVLPRYRGYGPLRLDLLGREGFVGGKALGLHQREFALLWRLLEAPGEQVDKIALLRDVWHLNHMPETNSIAVHASRLRSKLEFVGLAGIVQTAPSGGYFIAPPVAGARKVARAAPAKAVQGARGTGRVAGARGSVRLSPAGAKTI